MEDIFVGVFMETISDSYDSGNYRKYQTSNPLKKECLRRFNQCLLEVVKRYLNSSSHVQSRLIRVLDVGCGEGFITRRLADVSDVVEIVGVDRSREAVAFARKINPDIDFREGDIYALDFPVNSFDLVICSEVLEHLVFPVTALNEIRRIVHSGGGILLSVPNEPWFCLGNLLALHNVFRLGNPIDHVNHWTHYGFKKFLLQQFPNDKIDFYKSFPWSIAFVTCKK